MKQYVYLKEQIAALHFVSSDLSERNDVVQIYVIAKDYACGRQGTTETICFLNKRLLRPEKIGTRNDDLF